MRAILRERFSLIPRTGASHIHHIWCTPTIACTTFTVNHDDTQTLSSSYRLSPSLSSCFYPLDSPNFLKCSSCFPLPLLLLAAYLIVLNRSRLTLCLCCCLRYPIFLDHIFCSGVPSRVFVLREFHRCRSAVFRCQFLKTLGVTVLTS